MPMTRQMIEAAIKDRLLDRWPRRFKEEGAAPVAAIGIVQVSGPKYALPMICTTEDMDEAMLADLLFGIAAKLMGVGATGQFPQGKIGPDDGGELGVAVVSDKEHGVVRLLFGKPVSWLAMPKAGIPGLIDMLRKKSGRTGGVMEPEPRYTKLVSSSRWACVFYDAGSLMDDDEVLALLNQAPPAEVNPQLAGAAAELLACLVAYVEHEELDERESASPLRQRARAAIAKAEGSAAL
jgi:hypothetical protein